MKREAAIAFFDIQLAQITIERATTIVAHPVTAETQRAINGIWAALNRRRTTGIQRERRPRPQSPSSSTVDESLYQTAIQRTRKVETQHAILRAESARTYAVRVAAWKEQKQKSRTLPKSRRYETLLIKEYKYLKKNQLYS